MKLFKRNAQGKPIMWEGIQLDNNTYQLRYGLVGGQIHNEIKKDNKKLVNELTSLIKSKRKSGYKALEDLYDNAPAELGATESLLHYLNTYLPKFNTSDNGAILPMLAKTLEDNKPFVNNTFLPQWKINGVRCIISAEKTINDLFTPYRLVYHSREGTVWNLAWLDDIILSAIKKTNILDLMLEEGVCLDGELYLPGYEVNYINSFVKNNTLRQHTLLQYWCYDLCIENYNADSRYKILRNNLNNYLGYFITDKNKHLNNKQQFVLLPTTDIVDCFNDAVNVRDKYINLGFEGLILRNKYSEYGFGKRNSAMFKFKKKEDGLFKIVDIIPEGVKRSNLAKFVLKNDINDFRFECTINVPQAEQEAILQNKDKYLKGSNKYLALVEFRERSGIQEVPFHAKVIKLVKQ